MITKCKYIIMWILHVKMYYTFLLCFQTFILRCVVVVRTNLLICFFFTFLNKIHDKYYLPYKKFRILILNCIIFTIKYFLHQLFHISLSHKNTCPVSLSAIKLLFKVDISKNICYIVLLPQFSNVPFLLNSCAVIYLDVTQLSVSHPYSV